MGDERIRTNKHTDDLELLFESEKNYTAWLRIDIIVGVGKELRMKITIKKAKDMGVSSYLT